MCEKVVLRLNWEIYSQKNKKIWELPQIFLIVGKFPLKAVRRSCDMDSFKSKGVNEG